MKDVNLPNRMQNMILAYDLHQVIDEPTHFTEYSSSIIDLAIVNNPDNVIYSEVLSPFIPDLVRFHCPILVSLKFRKPVQKTFKRHVWLYDRGNYNLFRDRLQLTDWDALFTSDDVNEIADNITSNIINAAKESIPNMTVTIRPKEPERINAKIKTAIRQRKRFFQKAKRLNTNQAWNKFKSQRNKVTALVREQKKQYFEKLAEDLRRNSSSSKSWYKTASKFFMYDSNQQDIPPLETDNGLIEADPEKAEALNDFFVKQSTVDDFQAQLPQYIAPSHNTLNDIIINQEDVLKAIKDLDINKASGPDLINPKLIKEGKNELAYPYTRLFNLSIASQKFPDSYKKSNVTPIHKKIAEQSQIIKDRFL